MPSTIELVNRIKHRNESDTNQHRPNYPMERTEMDGTKTPTYVPWIVQQVPSNDAHENPHCETREIVEIHRQTLCPTAHETKSYSLQQRNIPFHQQD